MEQTECSETSAYKIQTPGNYPEENTTYRTWRKFEIKITLTCRPIKGLSSSVFLSRVKLCIGWSRQFALSRAISFYNQIERSKTQAFLDDLEHVYSEYSRLL